MGLDISISVIEWVDIIRFRDRDDIRDYVYRTFPDNPQVIACLEGHRSHINIRLTKNQIYDLLRDNDCELEAYLGKLPDCDQDTYLLHLDW